MAKFYKILCSLLLTSMLLGCQESKSLDATDTAVAFVEAIYQDKDMSQLMRTSGPQLREIFAHYRDMDSIQQHLLALELDGILSLQAISHRTLQLQEHSEMVDVSVLIEGTRDALRVTDDRRLRLEKSANGWVVVKIHSPS